jgi:hypothetical protein
VHAGRRVGNHGNLLAGRAVPGSIIELGHRGLHAERWPRRQLWQHDHHRLRGIEPIFYSTILSESTIGSGTIGDEFAVYMSGCSSHRWGAFVSFSGDPLSEEEWFRVPIPESSANVAEDGSASFSDTIITQPGEHYARWFCASSDPEDPVDPSILWMSSVYTFTAHAPAPLALRTTTNQISEGIFTLSVDEDALPSVDQIGIDGDRAAQMKASVDAVDVRLAPISLLYLAFLGRPGTRGELDAALAKSNDPNQTKLAKHLATRSEYRSRYLKISSESFVARVFAHLLERPPTTEEQAHWLDRLNSGDTSRTQMIQTVAQSAEHVAATENLVYVISAHHALTLDSIVTADARRFTRQLDSIVVRVAMIEDLAVHLASASAR